MRYIIDRKTNEHERYDGQNHDATKYRIVEADSDGWIAHTGNECPLPDFTFFKWRSASGDEYETSTCGMFWDSNVTHYKPILEPEKVQDPEPIRPHKWDAEGDRCVKCGDKDWMASQSCDESKLNEPALSYADIAYKYEMERAEKEAERKHMEIKEAELKRTMLLDRLKAAHAQAQTIPDLEAELREVLGSMGYDLVARSPFVETEPAVETPQDNKYAAEW